MPEKSDISSRVNERIIDYSQDDLFDNNQNANEVLAHRFVVHRKSEGEKLMSSVDFSQLSAEMRSHLSTHFPNLDRALWLFEKGTQDNIIVVECTIVHRDHVRLRYFVGSRETECIVKETAYARVEKLMATLAAALDLPSYRVFSADGKASGGGAHWMMYGETEDYRAKERAYSYSSYAIIEVVQGINVRKLDPNEILSEEDQIKYFKMRGRWEAYNYIFGVLDTGDEHFLVDDKTKQLHLIDKEESLFLFGKSPDYLDPLINYKFIVLAERQKQLYFEGMREFLELYYRKRHMIGSLLKRSINFGTTLMGGTYLLRIEVLATIEDQVRKLEKYLEAKAPSKL